MSYLVTRSESGQAVEISIYPNLAAFPASGYPGSMAIALDTYVLYMLNASTGAWTAVGAGVETDPFAIRRDNIQPPLQDITWGGFRILNLRGTSSPDSNTFIGTDAGLAVTSGLKNVFVGDSAGESNTDASRNSLIGFEAGKATTTGVDNVMVGHQAGVGNLDGLANVFIGSNAGQNNASSIGNTSIGYLAGALNAASSNSVKVGNGAGYSGTGGQNTIVGAQAGFNATTGTDNILIGFQAEPSAPGASNELVLGSFLAGNSTALTLATRDFKLSGAGKAVEFTGTLANYKQFSTTDVPNGFQWLAFQNQNAGSQSATTQTSLGLFTKDGAGLTDIEIFLMAKGSPTDVTQSFGGDLGFYSATSGGPFIALDSFALGAETAKDIRIGFNFDPQAMIFRATSGDVELNQGDLRINVLGKGLRVKTGTNSKIGQATLVAGTVIVANTSVNANSRIYATVSAAGGTQGHLSISKSVGVSFTITSTSALETSTVDWFIVQSIA